MSVFIVVVVVVGIIVIVVASYRIRTTDRPPTRLYNIIYHCSERWCGWATVLVAGGWAAMILSSRPSRRTMNSGGTCHVGLRSGSVIVVTSFVAPFHAFRRRQMYLRNWLWWLCKSLPTPHNMHLSTSLRRSSCFINGVFPTLLTRVPGPTRFSVD